MHAPFEIGRLDFDIHWGYLLNMVDSKTSNDRQHMQYLYHQRIQDNDMYSLPSYYRKPPKNNALVMAHHYRFGISRHNMTSHLESLDRQQNE